MVVSSAIPGRPDQCKQQSPEPFHQHEHIFHGPKHIDLIGRVVSLWQYPDELMRAIYDSALYQLHFCSTKDHWMLLMYIVGSQHCFVDETQCNLLPVSKFEYWHQLSKFEMLLTTLSVWDTIVSAASLL